MAEGIGQSALRKRLPQGVLQLWVDVDDSVPDATEVPFFDDFESWVSTALAAALTQTVDGPLSLVGEAHGLDTTGSMLDEAADAEPVIQFEISVRIVSASEMQALNRQYRQRDRPTNVLSFPSGLPLLSGTPDLLSLGDLVFCPQVVAAEAVVQEKSVAEHWAHLSVHGVLHLAGHDHEDEASAETMESLEIRILSELAIANPYLQPSAEQPPR